jgi:hypothetical protein
MKNPQDLNPLDAFREFAQNWHRVTCAALKSGFRPVLAARIRALCAPRLQRRIRKDSFSDFLGSFCGAREPNPAGRDYFGGDLPEAEFMARFAQELTRWPSGPTEFPRAPAFRQRYAPELINSAKVQELDIAGACRPPEDLVDGYVQWLTPSLGEVAFVIGEGPDTTNSAFRAYSLIRHYLRVTGGGELVKPKRLASDLNDLISDSRDSQSSVTCFYAHFTGSTRVLRYFNAGHRSPLLLRSNPNQVIRLNKGGPPLGYLQEQSYSEGTVQLKTGDRIVAFTHGVAESWATPSDSAAEVALLNIMRSWKHESAAEIADLIVAGGPGVVQRDRIAIVGSVNGAPSVAHNVCVDHDLLEVATS